MENGALYPVQLQQRDGSWVLVENVVLVRHGTYLRLEGELYELLRLAGMSGTTCYLPENMVYAIPLRYRVHGKHMARFFWVFADYEDPSAGMMRPVSWFESQTNSVRMSIADYLVIMLNDYAEKILQTSPPPPDMGDAEELAWLYEMYEDLMEDFPHLIIREQELYSDEAYGYDRLNGYWMMVEQDESMFVITTDGYLTAPSRHYVLRVQTKGDPTFRLVKPVYLSLKVLGLIQ